MQKLETLDKVTQFLIDKGFQNLHSGILPPNTNMEMYRTPDISSDRQIRNTGACVVAVIGTVFDNFTSPDSYIIKSTRELAEQFARYEGKLIMINGHCSDNSFQSMLAHELKKINENIPILGFSPWSSFEALIKGNDRNKERYYHSREYHDGVIYLGYDKILPPNLKFAARDLILVMATDALVSGKGRTGTNHEIALGYEMGKIVGLLKGSKGVTDTQQNTINIIELDGKNHFVTFYESKPKDLVAKVMAQIEVDHHLKALCENPNCQQYGMTSLDVYVHHSNARGKETVFNAWEIQCGKDEFDKGWQKVADRRRWHTWYGDRKDLIPTGKLLLKQDQEGVIRIIQDSFRGKLRIVPPQRLGENGVFLSPVLQGQYKNMVDAVDRIASRPETVYYQLLKI